MDRRKRSWLGRVRRLSFSPGAGVPARIQSMDKGLDRLTAAIADRRGPTEICAALRGLGSRRTEARVNLAEELLGSRYEGVQSVAAQTLGKWKSSRSLPALRAFLSGLHGSRFALRGVVAEAIGQALGDNDGPELIAWFLSLSTFRARFELLPAVAHVDPDVAIPLLRAAWKSADVALKHSILQAASELRSPSLLGLALRDRDGRVREIARGIAR